MLQWYLNVPAVGNVRAKWPLVANVPESHEPSSAVHVWLGPSRFVTVTDVPRLICSTGGENVKFWMVMAAVPGDALVVVVRAVVVVVGPVVVAVRAVVEDVRLVVIVVAGAG